ncbi:MAG TPA: hypothetical protein VNN17_02535, partial [Terriglobia bacterium]|nr:hypothetical protein [Terriglobia bacterium]
MAKSFWQPVLRGAIAAGISLLPARAQDYPRYPAVGSTYVPLDSWVYPAMDRLAGLGYLNSAILGLRPWTRSECARLVEEAGEAIRSVLAAD